MIRIGREIQCVPYAGFLYLVSFSISVLNRVEPLRGAGRKGGIEVRFIGNLT